MSLDENKKVEATKVIVNAATKQSWRSISISNKKKKKKDPVESNKDDNIIESVTEKTQWITRRYLLCRGIAVPKDNVEVATMTNVNVESNKTSPNAFTSLLNRQSTSLVLNDTESEKETVKEGKDWIVKVCLDLDIQLISNAFVSSLAISVEWQDLVNDEVVANTII